MTEQTTNTMASRVGIVQVGYRSPRDPEVTWTAEVDFTKVLSLIDKGQASERPVFGVKIRRNGFALPNDYPSLGDPTCTTGWVGGLEPSAGLISVEGVDDGALEREVRKATARKLRDLTVYPMGFDELLAQTRTPRTKLEQATGERFARQVEEDALARTLGRLKASIEQSLIFTKARDPFRWTFTERDHPEMGRAGMRRVEVRVAAMFATEAKQFGLDAFYDPFAGDTLVDKIRYAMEGIAFCRTKEAGLSIARKSDVMHNIRCETDNGSAPVLLASETTTF